MSYRTAIKEPTSDSTTTFCEPKVKVYYIPTKNIVKPKIPLYFRFRKFCDRITMPWRLK